MSICFKYELYKRIIKFIIGRVQTSNFTEEFKDAQIKYSVLNLNWIVDFLERYRLQSN